VVRVTSSRDDGESWTPLVVAYDRAEQPAARAREAVPERLLALGGRVLLYGAPSPAGDYPLLASDDFGASWHAPQYTAHVAIVPHTLELKTNGKGFTNFTREVSELVARSGVGRGLCTLFVRHTSASLVIQENADPAVLRDLARWFAELAPESRAWEHDDE